MDEQEILEGLSAYIMVIDKDNVLDDPFFKHCYNICMDNKDKLTYMSLWKIVDREYTLRLVKERKMMEEIRRHIKG